MSDDGASNQPKTRLWQRPLPLQRQDSNKNDFIDREFITRLQTLPNELPAELQWQDFEPRMCKDIARFYHENFMLGCGTPPAQFEKFIEYRMCANPPHLILMIVDSHSRERPEVCDTLTNYKFISSIINHYRLSYPAFTILKCIS